ncbi:MAG: adenylosuccinate synthetase [Lachnospiraceae bacterium]|nr:adenylosuccinate synthetase [Lachnospiraceae bacterium]
MIVAVIGKNFGDEGKGLVVDYFCAQVPVPVVVKHNGGAQAGHTVVYNGRRFVFHQLSSGSFRGAKTYFASTYYPDLFKLREEISDLGFAPEIYCSANTPLIMIDDVLINMAVETARGDKRHGSCGMGIWEGFLRTGAGAGLSAGELRGMNAGTLFARLKEIRESYVLRRIANLGLHDKPSEYLDLLSSDIVLVNAAEEMLKAFEYLTVVEDESDFLRSQENIVFETGQGLLLDSDNERFAPHVTASKTGLHNIVKLLGAAGLKLSEVCYVTRTYVTRHGAGFLPYETDREKIGNIYTDLTNVHNDWQGSIRYAKHGSVEEFLSGIREDLTEARRICPGSAGDHKLPVSLFITHLNETDGKIVLSEENMDVEDFMSIPEVKSLIGSFYLSYGEEAAHTKERA